MKAFLRHKGAWALVATVTVLCVMLGMYIWRHTLISPHVARLIETTVASRAGLQIKIGAVGGSYITGLRLSAVASQSPAAEGPVTAFAWQELSLAYNPLQLVRGWKAFVASSAADLQGFEVRLDLRRTQEGKQTTPTSTADQAFGLPALLPKITVRDGGVEILGPDYRTTLKQIGVSISGGGTSPQMLQLRVDDWRWVHPSLESGRTTLAIDAKWDVNRISIEDLQLGGKPLVKAAQLVFDPLHRTWSAKTVLRLAQGTLQVDGGGDPAHIWMKLAGDALALNHLPPWPVRRVIALDGVVNFKGELNLPRDRIEQLEGRLSIGLEEGRVGQIAVDHLQLDATVAQGTLWLPAAILRRSANEILLEGIQAPFDLVLAGEWQALLRALQGGFKIDCRRLPDLLAAFAPHLLPADQALPSHRLRVEGQIAQGRLAVTEGRLAVAEGLLRFDTLEVDVAEAQTNWRDAALRASLHIDLPQLAALSRILALPPLKGSVQGTVTASGSLGAQRGAVNLRATQLAYNGRSIGNATLEARADTATVEITKFTVQQGSDQLKGNGRWMISTPKTLEAHLELHMVDVAPYLHQWWPVFVPGPGAAPNIRAQVHGQVTVTGSLQTPRAAAVFDIQGLKLGDSDLGTVTLRAAADTDHIEIQTFEMGLAQDHIKLTGAFLPQTRVLEGVEMTVEIADLEPYAALLANRPALSGRVAGELRAQGPLRAPEGRARFDIDNFQSGSLRLHKATVNARYGAGQLHLDQADVDAPWGRVALAGKVAWESEGDDWRITLNEALWWHQSELLALQAPANVRLQPPDRLLIEGAHLAGTAGQIQIAGTVSSKGDNQLRISLSGFNGEGWLGLFMDEDVQFEGLEAQLNLNGRLRSPRAELVGDVARLTAQGMPVPLTGRFNLAYADNLLSIRRFEWEAGTDGKLAITAALPLGIETPPVMRPGKLDLQASLNFKDVRELTMMMPAREVTGGPLVADLQLGGTWQDMFGSLTFAVRELNAAPASAVAPPGPYDAKGALRLAENRLTVESLTLTAPDLAISGAGEWRRMPAVPEWLVNPAKWRQGEIAFEGTLTASRFDWLAARVEPLRRFSGNLKTQFQVQGPVDAPQVSASVALTEGELRPNLEMPSITALEVGIDITPQQITVQRAQGDLGSAPFGLTGQLQLDAPEGIGVDLNLRGDNLLLYRSEGLKVRADADIGLTGPLSKLRIAGEVILTDSRLVQYLDVMRNLRGSGKSTSSGGFRLFTIDAAPLRDARFDIRLTAKAPFQLRNNLIKGALRPDLVLGGTGQLPVLTGKVYVEPTRVVLPSGRLTFESGVIHFDIENPDRPRLNLLGKSRLLGYDVSMLIEGPYDEPIVTLSSVPPLSNEELLLLVLTGQPPKTLDAAGGSRRRNVNVAVYIGRDFIARWFGQGSVDSEESVLDRFNLEVGRGVTRSGDETIEAEFRLTENFIGQRDTLYLTGEKDVFDYYNAGVKVVFRFK